MLPGGPPECAQVWPAMWSPPDDRPETIPHAAIAEQMPKAEPKCPVRSTIQPVTDNDARKIAGPKRTWIGRRLPYPFLDVIVPERLLFHCCADTRQTVLREAGCHRDIAAAVNSHTSRRMRHDCAISSAEVIRDSSHGECSSVHIEGFILSISARYHLTRRSCERLVNEVVQDHMGGETVGIEERRSGLVESGSCRDYSSIWANDITGHRLRVTEVHGRIRGKYRNSKSAAHGDAGEQAKLHGTHPLCFGNGPAVACFS